MSFSSGLTALVAGLGVANLVPILGVKRRHRADDDSQMGDGGLVDGVSCPPPLLADGAEAEISQNLDELGDG